VLFQRGAVRQILNGKANLYENKKFAYHYGLGLFLGLGWGVAMPVMNAPLFDISPPQLKGFNTNLGVQMFQAGFFIGPLMGGLILTSSDFSVVFYVCAVFVFAGMAVTPLLNPTK
jgi:MFS family permease